MLQDSGTLKTRVCRGLGVPQSQEGSQDGKFFGGVTPVCHCELEWRSAFNRPRKNAAHQSSVCHSVHHGSKESIERIRLEALPRGQNKVMDIQGGKESAVIFYIRGEILLQFRRHRAKISNEAQIPRRHLPRAA
jgi:hypothetical protein